MSSTTGTPLDSAPAAHEKTGVLVGRLSEQVSTLVRQEVALAKLELAEKGKRLGLGIGLFGAAGLLAVYGLGAALVTVGLALALAVSGWLAALIVTAALFVTAGVLALAGKASASRGSPPVPTRAIAGVKADLALVKERRRG